MLVGAALGLGTWLVVGSPFGREPVTKAEIERAVGRRPRYDPPASVACWITTGATGRSWSSVCTDAIRSTVFFPPTTRPTSA